MEISKCMRLRELLDVERLEIKKEILKNKYYLSQKRLFDVGWKDAEKDFLENYLGAWATGFKAAYCNYICDIKDCTLKDN